MPLKKGQVLQERYRIDALLGQGGMGAVYRATDLTFDTPVAIKENKRVTPESEKQFAREARLLHHLRHPNLPRVTDHFQIPDQGQYLVMDYIAGQDLSQILAQRGPIPQDQALEWIGQVLDALECLHGQQPDPIIHRDVKPANIKITPTGQVFLVDFGLAKVYDPEKRTTTGARGVTPGYAPPEQYGYGRTDVRTDIYSTAATLYALLTGRRPADALECITGRAQLVPPRQINPRIQQDMEAAILRGMQYRPEDRFPNIDAFRAGLAGEQTETEPHVPGEDSPAPDLKRIRLVQPEPGTVPKVALEPPLQPKRAPRRATLATLPRWFWPMVGGTVVLVLLIATALVVFIGRGDRSLRTVSPTVTQNAMILVTLASPIASPSGLAQVMPSSPTSTLGTAAQVAPILPTATLFRVAEAPTSVTRVPAPPTATTSPTRTPTLIVPETPTATLTAAPTSTTSPTPTQTPQPVESPAGINPTVVFEDDFRGPDLDPSKWNVDAGDGEVVWGEDAVRMRGSGRRYPYLWSRVNPFPPDGDFRIRYRFHYPWVKDCGVGIIVTSYLVPVGLSQEEAAARQQEAESHGIQAGVWQDRANALQLWFRSGSDRRDIMLPGPDTRWHEMAIEYSGGQYTLYLDGSSVYTSQPTPHRPRYIWMGHPADLGADCWWSTLEVDYIVVESLP